MGPVVTHTQCRKVPDTVQNRPRSLFRSSLDQNSYVRRVKNTQFQLRNTHDYAIRKIEENYRTQLFNTLRMAYVALMPPAFTHPGAYTYPFP